MIPIIKPWLDEEDAAAAREAILSGWVAQGPRVRAFERAVGERVGAAEAIAVSSCTAALHLALVGAGLGPGDEVIVPSLSFIATTNAVTYCGARPVFADVCPVTQNLTAETVLDALTPACRAVVLVHQVGMPADIDAIAEVCAGAGLALIEDAACAIGSTYKGREIGAHSPLVVFSFHPRKVLTTGEGGMVLCRDPEVAARLRILRQHAMDVSDAARHGAERFVFERYPEVGFNYRMTDIQAAIGLVQLGRLDAIVARRRALADAYRDALGHEDDLILPADPPWGRSNHQSYCVRIKRGGRPRRDAILQAMNRRGIGCKRGIMAAHLEAAWSHRPHGPLPHTESWTSESFMLPLYHHMTIAEQAEVVGALRASLSGC